MSAYVNKVLLVGNLGQDPELRYLPTSAAVCQFSIATTRTRKDEFYPGRKEGHTDWHRIKVWGDLGEMCARYLAKGMLVYVEGRLENRDWMDKQTQKKRYITEVVASRVIPLHADEDVQAYLDEAAGLVLPREDLGPTGDLIFQNPPCGCSSEHQHSKKTGFCMEQDCQDCTGMK